MVVTMQLYLISFILFIPWVEGTAEPIAKLMVTNIDVQPVDANRVEFHGLMKASNTSAVVLQDIRNTGKTYKKGLFGRRYPIFSGLPLKPSNVARLVARTSRSKTTTTLLCMHGFNTQPSNWLKRCAGYSGSFTVIPVIWPANDQLAFWKAYRNDRNDAKKTGEAFQPLLDCLGKIGGKKCLMCHSMGNFVLKWSAPAKPLKHRFEDIFMVAADVDRDIFEKQEAGRRILNMVKNHVHILHSNLDLALLARQTVTIRRPALGFYGPSEKDPVKSLKCNAFARSGDFFGHSYFFSKEAIEYYESSFE